MRITRASGSRTLDTGERRVVVPYGYPLRSTDVIRDARGVLIAHRGAQRTRIADRHTSVTIPACDAIVFPYFVATYRTKDRRKVLIETVTSVKDRRAAQRLFHYLRWPPGLYVVAKVGERLAGVMVLARLAPHMRPKWRRELEDAWGSKYIEALWIRRVSVAKRFQGQGIGTALAKAAVQIARTYWLPSPKLAELIATDPRHNFLLRAGFTRAKKGRRGRLKFLDKDGHVKPKIAARYYYWTKL